MMKLLLDTHILLWWLTQDRKLSQTETTIITDPDNLVFVSAATAWEIAVKKMIGKLEAPDDLPAALAANNFLELPITILHRRGYCRANAPLPPTSIVKNCIIYHCIITILSIES